MCLRFFTNDTLSVFGEHKIEFTNKVKMEEIDKPKYNKTLTKPTVIYNAVVTTGTTEFRQDLKHF